MTILLLGDLTGRSRVALRILTYELEARGHEVLALPTALISNTLNLGQAAMLDTTDYLMQSLETWEKLGLTYDALYIGFVTGVAQAEKLCEIAEAAKKRGHPRRGRSDSWRQREKIQQRWGRTGACDGDAGQACGYSYAEPDGSVPDDGYALHPYRKR